MYYDYITWESVLKILTPRSYQMAIKSVFLGVGTGQKCLFKAPHQILVATTTEKSLNLNESFCLYLPIFIYISKYNEKTTCMRITKGIFLKMIFKIMFSDTYI